MSQLQITAWFPQLRAQSLLFPKHLKKESNAVEKRTLTCLKSCCEVNLPPGYNTDCRPGACVSTESSPLPLCGVFLRRCSPSPFQSCTSARELRKWRNNFACLASPLLIGREFPLVSLRQCRCSTRRRCAQLIRNHQKLHPRAKTVRMRCCNQVPLLQGPQGRQFRH